ncbi:hypothetical protein [Marinobacterium sp. BA1]|uniref:hypothetical protein n=1 Tax=Marinobacterium sp. BA1 TaxID=3138931 RepID=UPI0032E7BF12
MSAREQAFLQIVGDVVLSDLSNSRLDASRLSPDQFSDPDELRIRLPECDLGEMDEDELCEALSHASHSMLQAFNAGGQPEGVTEALGRWLREGAGYSEDEVKSALFEVKQTVSRACEDDIPVRLILPLKTTNDYFYEGVVEVMDMASIRNEFHRLAKISKDLDVDEVVHGCAGVACFTVLGSGLDDETADLDPAQLRVFSNGDLAHLRSEFTHGQDVVRSESFSLIQLWTMLDYAKSSGVSTIYLKDEGESVFRFCHETVKTKAEQSVDPLMAADARAAGPELS